MEKLLTIQQIEDMARERGMSITQLCAAADTTVSSFQRWKSGLYSPNLATYQRLVAAVDPSGAREPRA